MAATEATKEQIEEVDYSEAAYVDSQYEYYLKKGYHHGCTKVGYIGTTIP